MVLLGNDVIWGPDDGFVSNVFMRHFLPRLRNSLPAADTITAFEGVQAISDTADVALCIFLRIFSYNCRTGRELSLSRDVFEVLMTSNIVCAQETWFTKQDSG